MMPTDEEAKRYNQNLPGMGGVYNCVNGNLFAYAGNNPVRYSDPTGCWIDNENGTFTAEGGDTLWSLYGSEWKEKSSYQGDPTKLQVGETVGRRETSESLSSINTNSSERKPFLSNHEAFVSYQSNNGADAFYAGVGANFDIANGNFNLNMKTGIVFYESSWKVSDNKKFNFGLTKRASGLAADGMLGLQGSLFGVSADAHVFKGGGTIDITLWGTTISVGGDVMAGGIGGSILLGKNGFKAALDCGFGAGLQVTWRKEEQ